MNIETNRLNTFSNWPSSAPVDPVRIAKAGFFYTGEGTEVQCFSCGGKISNWNYGDQVMWRHRTMDPNCAFVVNPQLSGNIPMVFGRECSSANESTERLEFSPQRSSSRSTSDEGQVELESSQDYGRTEDDEMYKSDILRLLSFVNWNDPSVSQEALVNAGFYHAGEGRLRCAWCGGELAPFRNFGSLGSPLEVHRTYFPRCAHAASLEAAQRNYDSSAISTRASVSPLSWTDARNQPQSYFPPSLEAAHRNNANSTGQISSSETTSNQPQSSGTAQNARVVAAGSAWKSLGVVGGGARHAAYAALATRLRTFSSWPADRPQQPRALAEAGFYYTGVDDQVRCFYCDGGLGKWESGDAPWSEHAHWFPHCGYVLLVKGQKFVDSCRTRSSVQRTFSADTGLSQRRQSGGENFDITSSQIEECMESGIVLAVLEAGLDAARVRRALVRRLRTTGLPFRTTHSLIDAVLGDQLDEEAWSVVPPSQRFARDILAETLREFSPRSGTIPPQFEDESESRSDSDSSSRSPTPGVNREPGTSVISQTDCGETHESLTNRNEVVSATNNDESPGRLTTNTNETDGARNVEEPNNREKESSPVSVKAPLTLEEENRQLKEARLCKVCMDSEVSVVFLPCGHLVSCAGCGAALAACPLCRAAVRALVRAYLA